MKRGDVMLRHGILGLLSYGDMTGYELMEVFRDSLNYFWTVQTSQLYRELQTLKELGWVSDTPVEQAGRPDKKVFSITDGGRAELGRWLAGPFEDRPNRIPLLMRVFFSGELPPESNIAFFRALAARSGKFAEAMDRPAERAGLYAGAIDDADYKKLYWDMTIDFGRMYAEMLREWSEKCIEKLEVYKDEAAAD